MIRHFSSAAICATAMLSLAALSTMPSSAAEWTRAPHPRRLAAHEARASIGPVCRCDARAEIYPYAVWPSPNLFETAHPPAQPAQW